jgi:hypothetical protein
MLLLPEKERKEFEKYPKEKRVKYDTHEIWMSESQANPTNFGKLVKRTVRKMAFPLTN